jgi:general secretion pathway protein G
MVRRILSGSYPSLTVAALIRFRSRDREEAVQPPAPNHRLPGRRLLARGFTFIELMVVMAIIVVLITMAIPVYQKSIIRAKESVLKNNLFTLRTVIDNYTYDKQKAPQSLQDLVTEGYLREIPVDPMLASSQGWKVIMEDATQAVNQDSPGVFDVRSGSEKIGLDGTPYADW